MCESQPNRVVCLLKRFRQPKAFVFYTNYKQPKIGEAARCAIRIGVSFALCLATARTGPVGKFHSSRSVALSGLFNLGTNKTFALPNHVTARPSQDCRLGLPSKALRWRNRAKPRMHIT